MRFAPTLLHQSLSCLAGDGATSANRTARIATLRQEIRALERGRSGARATRCFPSETENAARDEAENVEQADPEPASASEPSSEDVGRYPGTPHPRPASSAPSLSEATHGIAPPAGSPLRNARRIAVNACTPWTSGAPALDGLLGAAGLDPAAVHEIKPETYADWPAALAFLFRLAVRRLATLAAPGGVTGGVTGSAESLLVWPAPLAADIGWPYAPGLAMAGVPLSRLLLAAPKWPGDALWVLEEGLKSQALGLVIGSLAEVALTPARRLSLAAAANATPCLLLTAPDRATTPAVATRWRIAGRPSAPHPLDVEAPGASRFAIRLERCQGRSDLDERRSMTVEWCDVAHRFRLVASLAHRTPQAARSEPRAGGHALRAG